MNEEYSLHRKFQLNYVSICNSFRSDMSGPSPYIYMVYEISVKYSFSINLLDKISEVWMKVFEKNILK